MTRHLVRSFVLASALCSFANAGPCRPSTSLAIEATTTISTVLSPLPTTETSQAEPTTITDTTVAVGDNSDTSTVTESETQTASVTAETGYTTTEPNTSTTTQETFVETTSEASTVTVEDSTTTTEASTTAAVPVPSCVNNLKVTAPENASCGVKGYATGDSGSLIYVADAPVGTRLDCYKSCVAAPNCQSFVFQEQVFCAMYEGSIGSTNGDNTSFDWLYHGNKPTLGIHWITKLIARIIMDEELQQQILYLREVAATLPDDHIQRPACLAQLSLLNGTNFDQTNDIESLDESIKVGLECLEATSQDDPWRGGRLCNVGSRFDDRYSTTGNPSDLEQACRLTKEAVQIIPSDHPSRTPCLIVRGVVLKKLSIKSASTEHIQEAINAILEIVRNEGAHQYHFQALRNLEDFFNEKYTKSKTIADLEAAIEYNRLALKSAEEDPDKQVEILCDRALRQRDLYLATKEVKTLDGAMETARLALGIASANGIGREICLTNLGSLHFNKFESLGSPIDLDESIKFVEEAITLIPDGDSLKSADLRNLTDRLGHRYVLTSDLSDIQRAIVAARQALELMTQDHCEWVSFSCNLALRSAQLYHKTRTLADLESAIKENHQSLELSGRDGDLHAQILTNLCYLLGDRYIREGTMSDLHEAITHGEVATKPPTSPKHHAARLMNLASALRERYVIFGDIVDLTSAIEFSREAIGGPCKSESERIKYSSTLGTWLSERWMQLGNETDLVEGLRFAREAYESFGAGQVDRDDRAQCASNLGKLLQSIYERTGRMNQLDESLLLHSEAFELSQEDDHHRALRTVNLSSALGGKYSSSGEVAYLDRAIQLLEDALKEDTSSPEHFDLLHNYSVLLGYRYTKTLQISDLDKACEQLTDALQIIPNDHPTRWSLLNAFATRLNDRFSVKGDIEDLQKAISLSQEASLSSFDPIKTRSLSTLGTLLGDRFLALGQISDIDNSIKTLEEAETRMPKTHFERPGVLGNLGVRFGDRYTRTGSVEDLDASVDYTRLASETTPRQDVNWAPRLSNLAARLGERYTMIGRAVDLDEAIRIGHELIALPNLYHTNHSVYLNNLALRLNDRYTRTGLLKDLETAVSYAQKSVDALPTGHTDIFARLRTLTSLLHENYRKTESDTHFSHAMGIANVAVEASAGGTSHPACLNNKAILLFNRFYVKKRQEDLIEATTLFRKAVELSPEKHSQRADRQRYLGDALHHMYTYDKDSQILDEAISCHRAAMSQANAPLGVRLRASRHLLQSLALKSDWGTAFEAAKGALDLVPRLVLRSLDNLDKQYLLTQVAGLACEATSIAIKADKEPTTAIKLLEQGRGILATSISDMRVDIEDLRESYPDLATTFTQNKEDLERLGRTTQASDSAEVARQYRLEEQFNNVVADIRAKPGFQDFLLAPSEQRIRGCVKNGSVVIINVSVFQCDAIILKGQKEEYVPLPEVDQDEIERRVQNGRIYTSETLEWLWDVIAKPIFDKLDVSHETGSGNWSRIWWIPTGSLSRFPLHAAGYHLRDTRDTVLDRVISSYSSSIRAMLLTDDKPLHESSRRKALLISAEDGDAGSYLPSAQREIGLIKGICDRMGLEVVVDDGRSKVDVKSHLTECKVFHFAGHGHTDANNPSMSYLKLGGGEDGHLTVSELMDLNLSRDPPFLAYLSACETGRFKDVRYADESLHLIGACQTSGFRHVIGTLWEVRDDLCVEVAAAVYKGISDHGTTDRAVCQGLHNAVRALRKDWVKNHGNRLYRASQQIIRRDVADKSRLELRNIVLVDDDEDEKLEWIPFVHFGN
ncbi:uncharacterized protein FIESC28_05945 [Fusarium coffeatum]|uniref:CHAT domain-containing protein n=1 Tax=Fusarium coffeatum TaxID=231269 RepID=A0A366RQ61_9HYPO|nr:uncharacterized protein FIESC28_05945 [Fusarium coffeatum]RBR18668.1 hypothetical protein FIESC28_05945 [Fusarium coffeatum]